MALSREDLPRFAAAAVCRGSRREEIVIDLTDAGVSRPFAHQMVDEIVRSHQELRSQGADGLEEKVLRAWLSQGIAVEFAASEPHPTVSEPVPTLGGGDVSSPGDQRRSGVLTTLAVVTLVLAVLRLALSIWLGFAGVSFFGMASEYQALAKLQQTDPVVALVLDGSAFYQVALTLTYLGTGCLLVAILFFFAAVLLFLAGVGLLRRRRWSRVLTLIFSVFAGGLAGLYAYGLAATSSSAEAERPLFILVLGLLIHGGYCVFVFATLLRRSISAEFA
jgi:hypothetical protein